MPQDIIVDHLSKTFRIKDRNGVKEIKAVRSVSFQIEGGSCVAFIGPNGAGKSTTLKMLTSILFPSGGSAEILGMNPWTDRAKLMRRIGAVFGQRSQLWYHLPARRSFDLIAAIYDVPDSKARTWTNELIRRFDLKTLIDKPVRSLSLGERMRCEIVASLIHQPAVLFLDEPTIGLDVEAKGLIRDLLTDQIRQTGTTVLMTSHDTGDIEQLCERVLMINHGRLILDTTVSDMKQNYLTHREITVTYDDGTHRTLQISAAQSVNNALTKLIGHKTIRDLSVSNPPLEDIIRALYKKDKGV